MKLTLEEALAAYPDLLHEVNEMKSEIRRHHRDFAKISWATAVALAHEIYDPKEMAAMLRSIRNIVG